jgi:alpha-L-glutamate ligase-like protein
MTPVLGINARNLLIARRNSRRAIIAAKDKALTKHRLAAAGIPVPATLAEVHTRRDAGSFDGSRIGDAWVAKPSRGSGGRGVLVAVGAGVEHDTWTTPSGVITAATLRRHLRAIVGGEHSTCDEDVALFDPLLRAHADLAGLTGAGLPDLRVVCDGRTPLLAMSRIPTIASGGRGNLHQGGIGAAVDLVSGRVTRAVHCGAPITYHPDTGRRIIGTVIPCWAEVVAMSARCSEATGLGYLGVDVVIDASAGPLVLEVNSHPGLEIQNVTGRPLRPAR